MCVNTLGLDRAAVKAHARPARCPACKPHAGKRCVHESGERPAWPGTLGAPAREDGREWWEAGTGAALERCSCAAAGRLDCSGPKSSGGRCRRASPRVAGLILRPAERDYLRQRAEAVAECGTVPVVLRRMSFDGALAVEECKVVMGRCGLRECPKCEAERRRERAVRAEGPHGIMVTLTLDPERLSVRHAWARIQGQVGRFLRAVQRLFETGDRSVIGQHPIARKAVLEWDEASGDRRRALPRVPYAWAAEPHESGRPHVHVALGLSYLCANWIRATWRRITRSRRVSPDVTKLNKAKAASSYLTKYITASRLSPDLCAITARARLFWASKPVGWEAPEGAIVRVGERDSDARALLSARPEELAMAGWREVVEGSRSFRHLSRAFKMSDEWLSADKGRVPEMPEGWPGDDREWRVMARVARAKQTGVWGERWWHDADDQRGVEPNEEQRAWLEWAGRRGMLARRRGGKCEIYWPLEVTPYLAIALWAFNAQL